MSKILDRIGSVSPGKPAGWIVRAIFIGLGGVALTGIGHKAWQMIKGPHTSSKPEEHPEQPPKSEVPLSADDPLWRIVGLGRTAGPTDLSENVDTHLAEAYRADTHAAP